MICKKVKLEFDEAKERLSRTLLIKKNTNLVILVEDEINEDYVKEIINVII